MHEPRGEGNAGDDGGPSLGDLAKSEMEKIPNLSRSQAVARVMATKEGGEAYRRERDARLTKALGLG